MRAMMATTAAALTLLLATPATAEEQPANSPKEVCAEFSEVAETIMERRQAGASMRRMMELAETDMQTAMVRDAYDQPAFSTERYQQRAVRRFGNDAYSVCFDHVTGE